MDTISTSPSGAWSWPADTNCGVYGVSGVVDGHIYVGSSIDLQRRKEAHHSALKNNRHWNHNLQCAYNEFGREAFVHLLLRPVSDENDLPRHEQEYIRHFARDGMLYNIYLTVPQRRRTGIPQPPEARVKIAAAQRKRPRRVEQTKARLYRFLSPGGELVETFGLRALCEKHGLNESHLGKVARGILRQHKGWSLPIEQGGKTPQAEMQQPEKA